MPLNLLDLPMEIIMTVIDDFCKYCLDPGDDSIYGDSRRFNTRWIRQRALAALAGTSRQLNILATPHLYHEPKGRWVSLIRTLFERPDLAIHVRLLSFDEGYLNHGDVAEVPAVAEAFSAFASMPEGWEKRDIDDSYEEEHIVHDHRNVIDFLLSLCPALTYLEIDLEYAENPLFPLLEPGALAELRQVRFGFEPTEMSWDMDHISRLSVVAPNLTTLLCHAVGPPFDFPDDVKFEKLTTLRLGQASLEPGDMDRILRTMPHLEVLELITGDATYRVFHEVETAREIQDAMIRRVPGLKSLEVCLESSSHATDIDPWTSLGRLTRLEHLDFDHTCVFPESNDVQVPSRTFFADLLPRSIQTVSYVHGPGAQGVAEAMLPCVEYLVSVKAQRFPSLRRLVLFNEYLLRESPAHVISAIKSALNGAGIEATEPPCAPYVNILTADEKAYLAHYNLVHVPDGETFVPVAQNTPMPMPWVWPSSMTDLS